MTGIDKKPTRKKSGPKPKIIINSEIIEEVSVLAGRGLTQQQIHQYYGISHAHWYKLIEKHPDLRKAVLSGKSKTISMVAGELIKAVRKGNVSAIIFYLKTQARWKEDSLPEDDDEKPSFPSITLTVNDPVEAARIYKQIMIGS